LIAIYVWRRRPAPGATALFFFMAGATIWSFGYAMELASLSLDAKLFWAKVQYLGIVTVPTMMLIIALEYSGQERWLRRRFMILLAIEPIIVGLLVWTNEVHGFIWEKTYLTDNTVFALGLEYGPGFWVNVLYSYLLLLIGSGLLLRTFLRSSQLYRSQAGLMLGSTLIPWVANALYQLDINPFPGLDLTPFAFTLTGLGAAWGLFRLQLMDITPVAHHAVFENMSDGVIVLDSQERIIDINPAGQNLINITDEQLIGQPIKRILPDWVVNWDLTESLSEFEYEITFGNSTYPNYFELNISPLFNRRKTLTGRIIVFRDITTRKQMESELVVTRDQALEANRFKSQILANVSHDMRTPLGAIIGYTEMLRNGLFGPVTSQQETRLELVLQSGNQLADFVDNLLEQSEISSGELILKRQLVSPHQLIQESLITTSMLREQKDLEVITEVDPQVPDLLIGDHYWLRRILSNLINNAIKFTKKGSITIRIYMQSQKHWAMQVSDTGIGIPESLKDEIFEPFRKGILSESGDHGAGLGLSIVKEIVTKMGGNIELTSEIGSGSTFKIILPLLDEEVNLP